MAQLQLYITEFHLGYSGLLNINPTVSVQSQLWDLRESLSFLDFDEKEVNNFFMVRHIAEGMLLSIVRTFAGERSNYRAATLMFPAGIEMTPAEREMILQVAFDALMLREFTAEATAPIRTALAHDYKVRHNAPHCIANHGQVPAVAYYGTEGCPSLAQYMNSPLYQPELSQFTGVWLINRDMDQSSRTLEDVTDRMMLPLTYLNPPPVTKEGFVPYIFHEAFKSPFYVTEGKPVKVVWRYFGFETLETEVVPAGPDTPIPIPNVYSARKIISPDSFNIAIEGVRKGATRYTIVVNGKQIDGPTPFTYRELCEADVEIASVGFFTYRGVMNLARTSQAMISLKAKGHTYRFDLPMDTPEPMESIRIYLRTKHPLHKSPIEGYAVVGDEIKEGAGHTNNLYYHSGRGRAMAIMGVCGLLAGLIIGYVVALFYPVDVTGICSRPREVVDTVQTVVPKPVRTAAELVDGPTPPPAAEEDTLRPRRMRPATQNADPAGIVEPVDLFVTESDSVTHIKPEKL
ncbi:MAG: hypothetical protein K2F99_05940 [Muribaculaceae bacterium]|nr:hypothetical protein [Muribaculaceae bacterium]